MTKEEFGHLFEMALDAATRDTEATLKRSVPRRFVISLHGAGYAGDRMDPSEALAILYLGEDRYYRIIDVATIEVGDATLTIFVRVSDHQPGSFEQTWNDPAGNGPFKQLGTASNLKISLKQAV